MKTTTPATVFHRFQFPSLGFDIDFIPHSGQAVAAMHAPLGAQESGVCGRQVVCVGDIDAARVRQVTSQRA